MQAINIGEKGKGMLAAFASGCCWGTYGLFSTLLINLNLNEMVISVLTPLTLAVFFFLWLLLANRKAFRTASLKQYLEVIIVFGGLAGTSLYWVFAQVYAAGMPVGVVSVMCLLNSLVSMVLSYFVWQYKFTVAKVVSMILVIFGAAFVLGVFSVGDIPVTTRSIIFIILIPILYSLNMMLDKYYILKGIDPSLVIMLYGLGSVVVHFLFIFHPGDFFYSISVVTSATLISWLYLLCFCFITLQCAYILTQYSIARIEPSVFGICYTSDPISSTLFGFLFLSQIINGRQLIGIFIVLAGVIYINIAEGREENIELAATQRARY
jgi:drug/metabolite transporter (DMT)-like permease